MTIIYICHRLLLLLFTQLVLLVPAPGYDHERQGTIARTHTVTSLHHVRLQYLLDVAVREGLPGVSLRIKGPGIDFRGAAGVANLTTGEPLSTSHAMYTASLGKTFTATVALQFYEEGRLDLEAPLTTWFPGDVTRHIPSSGSITLRHLLSHTSGLTDYMNDEKVWRSDFVRNPHRHWTRSDIVPYLYDKPLLFQPGSSYQYSNSNYILVGVIIEQVTGQSLHTLIRKRILQPLGLQHTFNGNEAVSSENPVRGYIKKRGRIIDTSPWYSHYGLADSGMHSTPEDLALFITSLFNSSEILSESTQMEMTNVSKSGHPPSSYGMGIYAQQNLWGAGYLWYTHDGIDPGYQADMMYLPEINLTIALVANASLGKANFIYEKLITSVVHVTLDVVLKSMNIEAMNIDAH